MLRAIPHQPSMGEEGKTPLQVPFRILLTHQNLGQTLRALISAIPAFLQLGVGLFQKTLCGDDDTGVSALTDEAGLVVGGNTKSYLPSLHGSDF